jgi:hypothetical protein
MVLSNVSYKHTILQWYSRPQRLSLPCLACIPMDNFKRRRYVKFKIKCWNRVAPESFASHLFRYIGRSAALCC